MQAYTGSTFGTSACGSEELIWMCLRLAIQVQSANELDLFAHDEYTALRRYFDYNPPQ